MARRYASDPELRSELIQLIEGSPQPQLSYGGMASRTGRTLEEVQLAIEELIDEGVLRREGDVLIAVEPAAGD
jgi:predicted transcriptional regulator